MIRGKELACNAGDIGGKSRSLGWEDPKEKEMVTHPNILALEIPWTEGLGGMQSMCGHKESDTSEQLSTHTPSKARDWDWLFCIFYLIFFHHPYEQVIIIAFLQ